jgi:predicted membrane protein (TIGR00267 family)
MDRATLKLWLEHWQDESDAAYLYGVLAAQERDTRRRDTYLGLADVERRHTAMWAKLLADNGAPVPAGGPAPGPRTRLLAWLGRRFGSGFLLPFLLREEGREVKGYLDLHKRSRADDAKSVSLTLARESAEHAETLASLTAGNDRAGEPWHRAESGGFLRNVVYGFNDGLTANFGLVAGVIGASVAPHIVLISGLAGMIADALSMGSSGYLAAKSEQEVYAHEIAMEREEIEMMPELEQEEMALIYEAKGIERARARQMAAELMQDPQRALDEQVKEELKIGESHTTPLREGWITGSATAVGAFIPVAPFLFLDQRVAMWTSFAIAMASHFAVGAARSVFTGRGILRSGIDMFVVGIGVAAVGYVVGDLVARLL